MDGERSQNRRMAIVASIAAVFVAALPMWWQTTAVYRAPLPLSSIQKWSEPSALDFTYNVRIQFYSPKDWPFDGAVAAAEIQRRVAEVYSSGWEQSKSRVTATGGTGGQAGSAGPAPIVRLAIGVNYGGVSPEVIDDIPGGEEPGSYSVFVKCGMKQGERGSSIRALKFTKERFQQVSPDEVITVLSNVAAGLFADEQLDFIDFRRSKSTNQKNLDFENMRVMKYSNEYQIAFSLLNGDPTDVVVSWDAKAALDAYVNPLLERLGDIYTFHLNSQVQNYATLPVTPDREVGSDGSVKYTLSAHSLSTFINSAEWNMVASTVSHAPPLNFVLYVPPRILTPLHLKRADGSLLESNAFLVHRWGGIVISNTPNTVSTPGTTESPEFHYTVSELQGPLSYFVAQLRTLCGVKPTRIRKASSLLPGVSITYDTSRDGITSWEYDRLLRFRVAAILRDAAGTLQSLATLVTSMPNMVVLDAIRDRVSDALDDMDDAREALNVGNETEALKRARSALKGAEDAFFDPTMVSLLYFPDEHKYAVYLPLFFPISVPLILALLDATKRTQGQRRWWRRQQ